MCFDKINTNKKCQSHASQLFYLFHCDTVMLRYGGQTQTPTEKLLSFVVSFSIASAYKKTKCLIIKILLLIFFRKRHACNYKTNFLTSNHEAYYTSIENL